MFKPAFASKAVVSAFAVLPLVVACSGPSVEDAEANLCNDLNGLATALQELNQINAQSTVKDVENAQKNVADAYASVRSSAADVQEARLDDLETAYADLEKTVNSIPGGDTLGEAATTIGPSAANVIAAREQLYSNLSCQ